MKTWIVLALALLLWIPATCLAQHALCDRCGQMYTAGNWVGLWRDYGGLCGKCLASAAPSPAPGSSDGDDQEPDNDCGSIIGFQTQTLGQVIPVSGTRHWLVYQSDRVRGPRSRARDARSLGLGGWMLSAAYELDLASRKLRLGQGGATLPVLAPWPEATGAGLEEPEGAINDPTPGRATGRGAGYPRAGILDASRGV